MDCKAVRDDMLDVLYEEATPEARGRYEEHEAGCAVCREEMAALRALRGRLASWRLPTAGSPPSPAGRRLPRFVQGLAWAAGLVLALGAGARLAGLSFEFQKGPFTVRLGGQTRAAFDASLRMALAEQQAMYRRDVAALRASLAAPPTEPTLLIQSVRDLIRESETRQADAFESRLAAIEERAEARRRYDLARISAGLSYLDGKAGQQAARTTELVSYVLQASQPQ